MSFSHFGFHRILCKVLLMSLCFRDFKQASPFAYNFASGGRSQRKIEIEKKTCEDQCLKIVKRDEKDKRVF